MDTAYKHSKNMNTDTKNEKQHNYPHKAAMIHDTKAWVVIEDIKENNIVNMSTRQQ